MSNYSPVCIGAMGGSGTRVVTKILQELGYYVGSDLNHALDNLWFLLFFKQIDALYLSDKAFTKRCEYFTAVMRGGVGFDPDLNYLKSLLDPERLYHEKPWLELRIESYVEGLKNSKRRELWGWKEPNSHIFVDRLKANMPNLKYIHVIRHGLDMAFSRNRYQLGFWQNHVFGKKYQLTAPNNLKAWNRVHENLIENRSLFNKSDFLVLKFEDLCDSPKNSIIEIADFLGREVSEEKILELSHYITPPESIGRYKKRNIDIFHPEDFQVLEKFGYRI